MDETGVHWPGSVKAHDVCERVGARATTMASLPWGPRTRTQRLLEGDRIDGRVRNEETRCRASQPSLPTANVGANNGSCNRQPIATSSSAPARSRLLTVTWTVSGG